MKVSGSKLIRTGYAYGHDIFWDVDGAQYVVFIDGETIVSKDIEELFREAEFNSKAEKLYERKTDFSNS